MGIKNVSADTDNGKSALHGVYRARVENNRDTTRMGKVQVRIPQFHGIPGSSNYMDVYNLPWASPITPTGTGYDHGSLMVPDIGDYVFVVFENGDRSTPLYLGGCFGGGPTQVKRYGQIESDSPSNPELYDGGGWSGGESVNEVPSEVYDTNSTPTGKVIYKSPKGATVFVQDKDEAEFIQIIDRIGQTVKLCSPVKKEFNRENLAQRTFSAVDKADKNPSINPSDVCVDGQAYIIIKDAAMQEVKLVAKGSKSSIDIKSINDVHANIDGERVLIDAADTRIEAKTTGEIKLSAKGSTITLSPDGKVSIQAKDVDISSESPVDLNTPAVHIYGDLIVHSD